MRISVHTWAMALSLASFLVGAPARAAEATWAAATTAPAPREASFSLASSYARTTLVGDSCCGHCGSAACDGGCRSCDDGCGDCCDDGCCGLAGCDGCPGLCLVAWGGLDTFRGITDGTFPGNFGLVSGLNVGHRLPGIFNEMGIGWQTGASYGLYDLQGRIAGGENASSQEQFFATTGFFRRSQAGSPLTFGMVYDWMINDNFGVFSREPFLGQWRGQIGWALGERTEVGWWGAFHDRRDQQGGIAFRGVSQQNMYLRRRLVGGADGLIYVGIPERNRLTGNGSLGEWIVGGGLNVPLGNRLGTYLNFAYMCPSAPAGFAATTEEAWQLGAGLAFFPGRTARSRTVAGRCWMPLMPVATNGTFLVDTNAVQ